MVREHKGETFPLPVAVTTTNSPPTYTEGIQSPPGNVLHSDVKSSENAMSSASAATCVEAAQFPVISFAREQPTHHCSDSCSSETDWQVVSPGNNDAPAFPCSNTSSESPASVTSFAISAPRQRPRPASTRTSLHALETPEKRALKHEQAVRQTSAPPEDASARASEPLQPESGCSPPTLGRHSLEAHECLGTCSHLLRRRSGASCGERKTLHLDTRSQLNGAKTKYKNGLLNLRSSFRRAAAVCADLMSSLYLCTVAAARTIALVLGLVALLLLLAVLHGSSEGITELKLAVRDAAEGPLTSPYLSHHSVGRLLDVVSATEVAVDKLEAAVPSKRTNLPYHWHEAYVKASDALLSIKGSDLVEVARNLQSADSARASLLQRVRDIEAVFLSSLSPSSQRPLLDHLHKRLQEDAVQWAISIQEVEHAWLVLNESCIQAETHFDRLATWSAASRRPSTASLAAVALKHILQQASSQSTRLTSAATRVARSYGSVVTKHASSGAQWIFSMSDYIKSQLPEVPEPLKRIEIPGTTHISLMLRSLRWVSKQSTPTTSRRPETAGKSNPGMLFSDLSGVLSSILDGDQGTSAKRNRKGSSQTSQRLQPGKPVAVHLDDLDQQQTAALSGEQTLSHAQGSEECNESFGRGVQPGGFQVHLNDARAATTQWEMLMVAPKLVRSAVDAASEDVIAVAQALQAVIEREQVVGWSERPVVCFSHVSNVSGVQQGAASITAKKYGMEGSCTLHDLLQVLGP